MKSMMIDDMTTNNNSFKISIRKIVYVSKYIIGDNRI